jgi:hypothetical protein
VIREMSPKITSATISLFSAPDAIRWHYHSAPTDKWSGEKPPGGAVIYYWLKEVERAC